MNFLRIFISIYHTSSFVTSNAFISIFQIKIYYSENLFNNLSFWSVLSQMQDMKGLMVQTLNALTRIEKSSATERQASVETPTTPPADEETVNYRC